MNESRRVYTGESPLGRILAPILEPLGEKARQEGVKGLKKDGEAISLISKRLGEADLVELGLEDGDKVFLKETVLGRLVNNERRSILKEKYRENPFRFRELNKLGFPIEKKSLFNEFQGVAGFNKLLKDCVNAELAFQKGFNNLETTLKIAKCLKDKGFRPVEFEGRETRIRMDGEVPYASVNPDIIVENDGRYMIEVKNMTAVGAVDNYFKHRTLTYTQAERYEEAVKQRGYAGVILAFQDPKACEKYPPNTLVEKTRPGREKIRVLNVKPAD